MEYKFSLQRKKKWLEIQKRRLGQLVLLIEAIARLRDDRNRLLAKTDFYALSDVTMSEAMTTYRQELRDLPSGLSTVEDVNNVTYPVKAVMNKIFKQRTVRKIKDASPKP